MLTPKENFLELLKPNGHPDRALKQYEALNLIPCDPITAYLTENRGQEISIDRWGTTIYFPKGAPGPTPHITDETRVIKDITRWRDYVHAPDIDSVANNPAAWEETLQVLHDADPKDEKVLCAFSATGIFEQTHFLLGFEQTLTNLYEHPDEMHELIEYIADYKLKVVKYLIENMHPEALFFHDDWGTKSSLFMKEEMWRDFFKEPYRRIYSYVREQGVIAIHHSDSYLVPIIEDMIEIGIQVWQGTLPENDIPALLEQTQGRLVLMGGVGAVIDREDSSDEEIREYVLDLLDSCPFSKGLIPSITYGMMGTVYPHVDPVIDQAIDEFNSRLSMPVIRRSAPRRLAASSQVNASASENINMEDEGDTLRQLATALKKGQKKRVLKLSEQALSEGTDAADILSQGLIVGMNELGEDFSANRAFVPEMLMAAKCMSAATEILKPHLAGSANRVNGKACIGTVKGDMHDIGKNLVKIMLEGSGLEVIDLGNDVPAETFIQTAIDEHCNLICCSSLLTTCMGEMDNVVKLAIERGIRDQVKIMVGGAPLSQQYCDEIGADAYTPDAASAARKAVELVS